MYDDDEEIPVEWVVQDYLDAADDERVWAISDKLMDALEEPFTEAEASLAVSRVFAVILLDAGQDGRDAEDMKTVGCALVSYWVDYCDAHFKSQQH